jgi:hypothetical protein
MTEAVYGVCCLGLQHTCVWKMPLLKTCQLIAWQKDEQDGRRVPMQPREDILSMSAFAFVSTGSSWHLFQ